MELLFEGETNRAVAKHALNSQSTRGHAVFTVYLQLRSRVESSEKVAPALTLSLALALALALTLTLTPDPNPNPSPNPSPDPHPNPNTSPDPDPNPKPTQARRAAQPQLPPPAGRARSLARPARRPADTGRRPARARRQENELS